MNNSYVLIIFNKFHENSNKMQTIFLIKPTDYPNPKPSQQSKFT